MKIFVKTKLVELSAEDEVVHGNDSWTKHSLPDIREAVKSIVEETVKLHKAVAVSEETFKKSEV